MKELETYAENTWCPGCGNFGIKNAFERAVAELAEKGIDRNRIFMCHGIGQHGKGADYINLNGTYGLHGRTVSNAEGVKLGNPELKVVDFVGDGDSYGEGLSHLIFAAKRNADIVVFVHNNMVYGLTTGQYTPTSPRGYKGPSTPEGLVEDPINPLTLALEAGATWVGRSYSGKIPHLADMMVRAVEHEGFALLDILQPCVTFYNTYEEFNERTEIFEDIPETKDEARHMMEKSGDKIPLGVFYTRKKEPYHRALMGDHNPYKDSPSREERIKKLEMFLKV